MAREISFTASAFTFQASMIKVEREKLYGWTVIKTFDNQKKECKLVNLLDDGKTIVPSGGFSIKCLTNAGTEISRSALVAVNYKGEALSIVPSVFDQPVVLDENKTLDDYLNMRVKSVYQLTGISDKTQILATLHAGKMLSFVFNYRADYEGDDAFLIAGDSEIFVVVGKVAAFEMIGLDTPVQAVEMDEEQDEDIDFGML